MVNTHEFARPVRRSLLQRDMFLGVPQAGLLLLFIMAVVFVYGFQLYFMLAVIVVLFLVMRALSERDPWLIDAVLESIQQKDLFYREQKYRLSLHPASVELYYEAPRWRRRPHRFYTTKYPSAFFDYQLGNLNTKKFNLKVDANLRFAEVE
jgi:type IV secretory pathway VirB3-like protein